MTLFFYSGQNSIGRGMECDLYINGRSLSREHAVILVEGGTHFVMDNGSRNNTFRKTVSDESESVEWKLTRVGKCKIISEWMSDENGKGNGVM